MDASCISLIQSSGVIDFVLTFTISDMAIVSPDPP